MDTNCYGPCTDHTEMLVNSNIATPCCHVLALELILLSNVLLICLCLFSLFYGSYGLQQTLCTTCISVPNPQCIYRRLGWCKWCKEERDSLGHTTCGPPRGPSSCGGGGFRLLDTSS